MDNVYIIMFIMVLFYVVQRMTPKPKVNESTTSDKFVIERKKCPPHQWFWQEIVDQDGIRQGDRIVCKVCGPLSDSLNKAPK